MPNVRDNVNIKLSDATAAELAKRPIEYDTGYTLLPGKYMIKFLARDDETGRIGTFQTTFVIPNLNKVEKRVPISAVVLSSQRVDLNEAIYDAAKAKDRAKDEAVNPLVQDGGKLIPSVTRVFGSGREIYVYFQAYKQTHNATRIQAHAASFRIRQSLPERKKCTRQRRSPSFPIRQSRPRHHAAELRSRRGQSSARQIRLPGDGARSVHAKGGFLACADLARISVRGA